MTQHPVPHRTTVKLKDIDTFLQRYNFTSEHQHLATLAMNRKPDKVLCHSSSFEGVESVVVVVAVVVVVVAVKVLVVGVVAVVVAAAVVVVVIVVVVVAVAVWKTQ